MLALFVSRAAWAQRTGGSINVCATGGLDHYEEGRFQAAVCGNVNDGEWSRCRVRTGAGYAASMNPMAKDVDRGS